MKPINTNEHSSFQKVSAYLPKNRGRGAVGNAYKYLNFLSHQGNNKQEPCNLQENLCQLCYIQFPFSTSANSCNYCLTKKKEGLEVYWPFLQSTIFKMISKYWIFQLWPFRFFTSCQSNFRTLSTISVYTMLKHFFLLM